VAGGAGHGSHLALGPEQGGVAGSGVRGESSGRPILDDPAVLDDQDAGKALGLAHVVGHAQERGLAPAPAGPLEQAGALAAIQPTERLVEQHQPDGRTQERPPEAHPLPLAAR
jgi:hypothetical protein